MDDLLQDSEQEVRRLRRCMIDLVGVLALPAVWIGNPPQRILETFLDALLDMLDLDFIYGTIRLDAERSPAEVLRIAPSSAIGQAPDEIRRALDHWSGRKPHQWPHERRRRFGDREVSILPLPLGIGGDLGLLVAGTGRPGFPEDTERLVLCVAANQAAIALQHALRLNEQKQIASELDRRVAERTQELAETNRQLQLQVELLQRIPVAAWTLRPDGTPDFVNQVWLQYSGQTLDFVRSHPEAWMTAVHPDDREAASRAFWDGVRSEKGFAMETRSLRARDGVYRWHLNQAVPLRDADGKVLKFVGATTDIDNQKRAEEALRLRELNLLQITETIPEMLWSASPDGAIEYCNGRLLDYTGMRPEQIMSNGWMSFLHPDDVPPTVEVWNACVRSGAHYRVEVRTFHAADRTWRWCVASALPLLDQKGRIVRWHGTVVDMHDWKKAQEELHDTQAELGRMMRMMTVGQLTASIAHEINQPLSGIVTNASTCLRMLDADPPNVSGARETARRALRDGNRASDVILRLRTLFASKEVRTEPVDINDLAREVMSLFLPELQRHSVTLHPILADELPLVEGDRVQLQQVILNLFRNAQDAMSTVEGRPRELRVSTRRSDLNVHIEVQDSGIGFDPAASERLFESFYTTKQDGMGIGLSVSRSIIEAHNGRLWAKPNDGPGATFGFSVPCR